MLLYFIDKIQVAVATFAALMCPVKTGDDLIMEGKRGTCATGSTVTTVLETFVCALLIITPPTSGSDYEGYSIPPWNVLRYPYTKATG
jgi:hypothetical protein